MRYEHSYSSKNRTQEIMKSKHTIFFIFLFCIVVLATILSIVLKHIVPQIITPLWPLLILFFAIVNIIIYFINIRVKNKNDISKLTNFHMLVTYHLSHCYNNLCDHVFRRCQSICHFIFSVLFVFYIF